MRPLAARLRLPALDVRAWARTLAVTSGMQALVQGLAFLGGLLAVRLLEPAEYALYTIAHTVLGAMLVISDAGVSNGVLANGGRVWQDRAALGSVIATGQAVRHRMALLVAALAVPATFLLLRHQGSSVPLALALSLAPLPLFFATARTNVLEVVLRLRQDVLALQRIQASTQSIRLVVLAVALTAWPLALVAVFVAAVPQWWHNARLRRRVAVHALPDAPHDERTHQALRAQVRRSLPMAFHYAISGQLAVFLVTLFGSTASVAAVGALGRLAMILTAVGGVFTLVVVPRFARLPASTPATLRSRYWLSQALFALTCAVPVAAIAVAPGPALALLGPAYAGLETEALLAAAGAAIASLSGLAFSLASARGIVAPPSVALPLCIGVQVLLVVLLPVHSVAGVLWVGLLTAATQWALHLVYFERRLRAGGQPP